MNKQYVLAPQPTLKRIADIDGPDFYPTPRWATRALLANETFQGRIWECACGDGNMSSVLAEGGNEVISSDLYDRGFGTKGIDFTQTDQVCDNIITNPPYNLAEDFVHKGVSSSKKKLALLLRLAFLESAKRKLSIFDVYPPSRVWVFSERITFYPKGAMRKGSGTTAYAWFVWDQNHDGPTQLGWLPTGMKAKYG